MLVDGTKLHTPSLPSLVARLLRWDRGVVANDLPAIRRLLKDKQKMAVRVAPSGRRALQMKMSGYRREVFVEWLHLELGKVQRAHLLFRRVVLAIRVHHLSVATRNLRTNEENIGRVLVAGGKRVHVPAVPIGNLLVQHGTNGLS